MATNPQLETLLNAEDRLIESAASGLEDTLAAIMDQAILDFERTKQFAIPRGEAIGQLLDSLAGGWRAGVGLGVEQLEPLATKQSEGLTMRAALEYLEAYGVQRTRQITATTAKQLSQIVVAGQREGQSTTQIMRSLVNKVPKLAATRAKIIAETEIHSATQFGAYNAALRSSRLLVKFWNTQEDDRVRDFLQGAQFSHASANRQKKPLDNPFQVPHIGGSTEALRFPGDPEGSAGNIIRCRCAVTYEEP